MTLAAPRDDDPGADDADEAAALRARRRAAARRHHPDLGGDPEAFRRAMAAAEAPEPRPAGTPPLREPAVALHPYHRVITAAAVVAAGGVRLVDGVRARLSRSLPDHRRDRDR